MERILLVEDDRGIVRSLREFLTSEGFAVEAVDGQRAATERLAAERFDLLLVDISLADGNGFAVCKAAKERGLPVIDLFTPMDALDRERYWRDVYHFTDAAVDMQADIIARHVLGRLGLEGAPDSLERARTATGPDGRMD